MNKYMRTQFSHFSFSLSRESTPAVTVLPARGNLLVTLWVTFGHQDGAGEEHEVFVAVGLDQCRKEGRLPANGGLLLGLVAQVVGEAGGVVRKIHAQLQSDWLTAT